MLQKTTHMNFLYDFYHVLLTERQKEFIELYYREDYSLVEIAELSNVSRQAVYDNIKRTEQILGTYEKKLKLYDKFLKRNAILSQIKELTRDENIDVSVSVLINQLEKLN